MEGKTEMTIENVQCLLQTMADILGEKNGLSIKVTVIRKEEINGGNNEEKREK